MSRLKERQLKTDSVIHNQEGQHLTICLHPGCQSENYSLDGFCLIRRDRQDIHNTYKQSNVECATIKVVLHCMSSQS